jgi:hypothetical protein
MLALCAFASSLLNGTLLSIEKVPTALLFVMLGFFLKNDMDKLSMLKSRDIVLCMLSMIFLALSNEPVEMYRNYYGNYTIFLATSILGIIVA